MLIIDTGFDVDPDSSFCGSLVAGLVLRWENGAGPFPLAVSLAAIFKIKIRFYGS